jgi:hypothetical protein
MSQDMEIGGLDFAELSALRGRIDDRVRKMRETGGPALLVRFAEEAGELA